jgi:16S rRNA (adenine1518-N6/adenine1519-N6)-dimethyltransferase
MSLPPLNVPQLLRQYDLTPRKSLGQNFLIEPTALERVISASKMESTDHVLEIGAGLGSLTRLLAVNACHVTAVEIDRHLIPILQEVLKPHPNITLIQGDIMELSPAEIMQMQDYVVVANIPYYITSALLRHLLEASLKPRRLVLTIQKEVAARICTKDGKMSLLALSVQVFGTAQIAAPIPAGCFYPIPTVDSSVLVVELYKHPLIPTTQLDDFFTLIHAGFSQKRKMLRNSFSSRLPFTADQIKELLIQADIDPQRRAESLTLDEWKKLTMLYHSINTTEEES